MAADRPAVIIMSMDNNTLRVIEYDKVKALLRPCAASSLGKAHVDRMRPVRDPALARLRLAETGEACHLLETVGDAPLGGLHDVRDQVRRAAKDGVLTAPELQDIAETAACCRRLHRYLAREADAHPHLAEQGQLLPEYTHLERAVDQAISPQGEVLDAASVELARARQRIRALHERIQQELQRIISSPDMATHLQDPIITQRNGRFCVPVRAEQRNAFKGIVHDLSASGQTVFMEPLAVVELGNDLREAERREEEETYRVLAALSAIVGKVAEPLLAGIDAAGRLDLIFARAAFARQLRATPPTLNEEGIVELRQARHPLLGDDAVPIDVMFGHEGMSTLLITGPNTGGKTVTLKTVGLCVLMAQSGMHIPADEGSRVPIVEQVFADIGDEQSIEQSLSTFSGHMRNIVNIVKEAGPNALVLFDEIGAGTDPAEGAALAKAVLLELQQRGCRTIATTHYGELKVFAQNSPGFLNASVEFDLETLRPTYRIITGLPGSSYAFAISQRLGLPKAVIAHAKELVGEVPQAIDQVLKQAEGVRRALDRERTAAGKARREAEIQVAQLQRELQEMEAKREHALARARQQAQEIVQRARVETNALQDELKAIMREYRDGAHTAAATEKAHAVRRRARQTLRDLTAEVEATAPAESAPLPEEAPPALTEVTPGQTVLVRRVGHRGTVLTAGKGEQEVDVQVGIMRVRVPVSDLEAAAVAPSPPPPAKTPERHVQNEIHLLGLRAEEAEQRLDEYLYDALTSGHASVRIVHGFGTGVLRGMVQQVLRGHPTVRSYRAGTSQEGGGGVTIAELGR
jgi:DNA mismatch repair protein MutS2